MDSKLIRSAKQLHSIIDLYDAEIKINDEITREPVGYHIESDRPIQQLEELCDAYGDLNPDQIEREKCYVYKFVCGYMQDVTYTILCPYKWML